MSHIELLPRYDYKDYLRWEGDWELIEGMPVSMSPAPTRIHQRIATQILYEMKSSLDEEHCKECEVSFENDWKISSNTVVRPDIVFVCGEENEIYLTKAPKIIVEVISPSTAKKDEIIKFDIYENEKVDYYILVYPDDLKAKVYRLRGERYSKVGDFTNEKLIFEDIGCELELDFQKVFKRSRE